MSPTTAPRHRGAGATLLALALLAVACTPGGPILANPTAPRPSLAAPSVAASRAPDPAPIVLPRDDGPHDRLTEWWYYTGHVAAIDGPTFGFEFVVFRAERGGFPVSWASHLALTEEVGGRFLYDQRTEVGAQADRSTSGGAGGFDLAITGTDPSQAPVGTVAKPWTMSGAGGSDRLRAVGGNGAFGIDLALEAAKAPALHGADGWIDFGPAGGSYYYSRTAMTATGAVVLDGVRLMVSGTAWFDHQWGDFISVGGGGWDWFAVNLADGTDLTLSLVRDADGSYPLIYGTVVAADGTVSHLDRSAFSVEVRGHWTSPATGATYPAGWTIVIPRLELEIELTPTVADQELDTRATTGVVYWEGSQRVAATRDGRRLGGKAYVELTGYAASIPDATTTPAP
jgi:predicted secreted hydrolase